MILFTYFCAFKFAIVNAVDAKSSNDTKLEETRRILGGHEVGDTRPYMVYLRPAVSDDAQKVETEWLCGGVIIHERYVLTSAACIEDVKQFYVISGTHRLISAKAKNDECIINGAKKAIWKCVPKSYHYDGNEFDNIRWMIGDIAIVKVEDNFNFARRIRGCDFIPKPIAYNNQSEELEKPGTIGSIAGWGSTDHFGTLRNTLNSPILLETNVVLISKKNCKKRWDPRYHYIIDHNMICAKDSLDTESMSMACSEREVDCKDLVYSDEGDDDPTLKRRQMENPKSVSATSVHKNGTRRSKVVSGGFCENDHGGPLVVGQGKSATVVGVISACMSKDLTNKCYGPFLYTSVFRNRNLINCAINKDIGLTCRGLWRSSKTQISETFYNWVNHSDGPAKSEIRRSGHIHLSPTYRASDDNTTTITSKIPDSASTTEIPDPTDTTESSDPTTSPVTTKPTSSKITPKTTKRTTRRTTKRTGKGNTKRITKRTNKRIIKRTNKRITKSTTKRITKRRRRRTTKRRKKRTTKRNKKRNTKRNKKRTTNINTTTSERMPVPIDILYWLKTVKPS